MSKSKVQIAYEAKMEALRTQWGDDPTSIVLPRWMWANIHEAIEDADYDVVVAFDREFQCGSSSS